MKGIRPFILVACLAPAIPGLAAEAVLNLTLKEAREQALQKHPRITVAELKGLVARKAVREIQSGYLPNLSANLGAVGAADDNTRITTSGLTVSSVFNRASAGVSLTQLVTDFGRTANLTEGTRLHAQAEAQNIIATRAQIVLQVDGAYFGALQAQSVRHVTEQTVTTRQLLRDRVRALADNQLKSDLDVTFAEVSLQEAKLLQSRAENDVESALATLSSLLVLREPPAFKLADEAMPGAVENNVSDMITAALSDRPELLRLRLDRDSAVKLARAEKSSQYPTISVQGSAGAIPFHDAGLNRNYAAAGVVLSFPLYIGGLYSTRHEEAVLRARTAEALLKDEEENVVKEVRIAWLNAKNAWARLAITTSLVDQARQSHALADARYKAGSSSFVELSQAQLSLTSAEITHANAKFEYSIRRSILDYQTGRGAAGLTVHSDALDR